MPPATTTAVTASVCVTLVPIVRFTFRSLKLAIYCTFIDKVKRRHTKLSDIVKKLSLYPEFASCLIQIVRIEAFRVRVADPNVVCSMFPTCILPHAK